MIPLNEPPSNTHKLVIKREFDVPRETLWKAWTEPSQVKVWLGLGEDPTLRQPGHAPVATCESVKMDLRVGGRFRIQLRMTDGEYFTAAGTYLDVKVPERLVYTWDWEKDGAGDEFGELEGAETQLTVEFIPYVKGTQLVLTHEKFTSVEKRDRHIEGWGKWFDRMEKYLKEKK